MNKRTKVLTCLLIAFILVISVVPMTAFAETTLSVPTLTAEVAKNEDYPIDPFVIVTVMWEPVEGAEGYEVDRKQGDGEWIRQEGDYTAESFGHRDIDTLVGAGYTYRVRAYCTAEGEKVYSEWVTVSVEIPDDAFKTVILAADADYIISAWTLVSGAEGYSVERSTSETGEYTVVGEADADEFYFVDYPLDRGVTYYYKVKPIIAGEKRDTAPASAKTGPTKDFYSGVTRINGPNRYDTAQYAVEFYKKIYSQIYDPYDKIDPTDKFRDIIVASGSNYADALAGSYLASALHAPILLISEQVEGEIVDYIRENLAETGAVYILGGTGSVSKSFEETIGEEFYVERLGGTDRYMTNIEILKAASVDDTDLIVCSGLNFADALSAASLQTPILLVGNSLTSAQTSYLNDLAIGNIYIIGGMGSVSEAVENQLRQYDSSPERIFGANRYETSLAVARRFFGTRAETAVLAYGGSFPDGLSGSPIACGLNEPIILAANSDAVIANIAEYAKYADLKKAIVFGGPTLISDENVNKIIQ